MSDSEAAAPVAFVAGASGAIGGAVARRLAEDGYELALGYRSNEAAVAAVAADLTGRERTPRTYRVSLPDYGEVAETIAAVKADFGRIDAAIYAAGPYLPQRWITEFEPGEVEDVLRADTVSCWNLCHASIPALRESGGSIVAVSTPAVRRHAAKDLLSSVPKAAIEAIIRGIASEEGKFGVRANAVAVGALGEGMYDELVARGDFDERWLQNVLEKISLRRLGTAAEIAEAIAFLASAEKAGYVSGQTLTVDGGYAL